MNLAEMVEASFGAVRELRRKLHTIPELYFQEHKTADVIRAELDKLGASHVDGVENAPTATVCWIGDTSKPCIALRADIDGLPIREQTSLPYASTHEGNMHACGHDGHMATLIGTIAVLKQMEDRLPVCVKFLFQPAEEHGGGAERLVKGGVLDGRIGPKVKAIFGLHGWPTLKVGTVATKPGPIMAATGTFAITFIGKGCHGAYPHFGIDPIVTAAEAVINIQQFASREFDPTDCVVVTVGKIAGGTAVNIIPDTTEIHGTIRTLGLEQYRKAAGAVERRVKGIAAANGCEVKAEIESGYPPVVNDPEMADYVAKVARETLGPERFIPIGKSSMGGEDFAYYLQELPGCFFMIGTSPQDRDDYPNLHSDRYDFTDEAAKTGMRMFVELVMRWRAYRDSAKRDG